MDTIAAVLITGIVSIICTIITASSTQNKMQQTLQTSQAVTDEKMKGFSDDIKEMKADLKEHNGYAKRMPVIEERLGGIEEDVKELKAIHKRQ